MIMQSLAGRALLCLLAGSIFTLGLAPFDLKLLSLVSMAVFAFALTGQSWRPSLLLGWCFGLCLLYTSPSPRDVEESRMPSSA